MDTNELLMKIARKETGTEPILSIRQSAVDMAIRIKSIQSVGQQLSVDLSELPKHYAFDVEKHMKDMQDTGVVAITPQVKHKTMIEEIIDNAERITNFIIDGTTGNKRDNQEVL